MEARNDAIVLNNPIPPHAAFKKLHYLALGYILKKLPLDARKEVFKHMNHYFRGTQGFYNSAKFAEACGLRWDNDSADLVEHGKQTD